MSLPMGVSPQNTATAASGTSGNDQQQQILQVEDVGDNLDELQLQTPSLSDMNQSALSVETESTRGLVANSALEVSGGYISNLYNRSSDVIGSGFSRYTVPLTLNISKSRTRFIASYLPQLAVYSAASGVYQTHVYDQTLLYGLSNRTTLSWQLSGARYRDVGQFLPVVLPTGGTGIAQPLGGGTGAGTTSTISNAATSIALLHKLSARDQVTLTGTAAWNELLQAGTSSQPSARSILRNQSFAVDAIYEHALSSSVFVGVEGTAAYVRGLSNATTLNYETGLGTLRYIISASDSFSVAAGPLIRSSSNTAPTAGDDGATYALNARYTHQSSIGNVSASFTRVIQLSLDNSATPANQFSTDFVRPVMRNIDLTLDLRYIRTGSGAASAAEIRQTNFGGSVRVDYRTGTRLSWFATASLSSASQPAANTGTSTFTRNEMSGGLRFILDPGPVR
ncbi:MAG: hypothetical protein ABI197_11925 [Granulicella sp.]